MIKSIKIRLLPTKEQEVLMWKSVGCARFAYNWGLAKCEELYKAGTKYTMNEVRSEFNRMKKTEEYAWLNEVSGKATAEAFRDLETAYKNFFKRNGKHPKFKSKRKSKPSFYARYDSIVFTEHHVKVEKLGKIKYHYNKEIPQLDKYINPRISFDGKYWYLSLSYEHESEIVELTDEIIGIDVGVKELAVVSSLEKPIPNINKSARVRKIEKKLRRLQRQVSRKYEMNREGKKYKKTANIVKLEKEIKKVHRRLRNIRNNHLHQASSMIVKTKPSRIVMEHLNITGMMRNRHLAKAIQKQSLNEFKRQIQYKAEFYGIEFVEADRFYPSSKICSDCGHVKKDLKLSDRIYRCDCCGLEIDRDKNASINLSRYQSVS